MALRGSPLGRRAHQETIILGYINNSGTNGKVFANRILPAWEHTYNTVGYLTPCRAPRSISLLKIGASVSLSYGTSPPHRSFTAISLNFL